MRRKWVLVIGALLEIEAAGVAGTPDVLNAPSGSAKFALGAILILVCWLLVPFVVGWRLKTWRWPLLVGGVAVVLGDVDFVLWYDYWSPPHCDNNAGYFSDCGAETLFAFFAIVLIGLFVVVVAALGTGIGRLVSWFRVRRRRQRKHAPEAE